MAPSAATILPSHHGFSESMIKCHATQLEPVARPVSSSTGSGSGSGSGSAAPPTAYTAEVGSFNELVQTIRSLLGPSSGLDSDDVNVESLMSVIGDYDSSVCAEQWQQFALADPSRSYTRNGVDECNKKANLLVLVWNPGKGSMIHDHANAHCILKVLQGSLVETLYEWPEDSQKPQQQQQQHQQERQHQHHEPHAMTIKKESTLHTGNVSYMSDKIGLHRMSNPSSDSVAVSLHLYTPPYAAKFGCLIFEEDSGRKHHVKMSTLYSDKGVLVKSAIANSC